jgi:biopolymer transport protein ExbB/TolQ
LLVSAGLVLLKPLFAGLNVSVALVCCAVYGLLVAGSAVLASTVLRGLLHEKFNRKSAVLKL